MTSFALGMPIEIPGPVIASVAGVAACRGVGEAVSGYLRMARVS